MKIKISIINKKILCTLVVICSLVACKESATYEGEYNPEIIKSYRNENISKIENKMDSLEAVNFIVKQKLLQFYELSALASNKNDSAINVLLIDQLKSYFPAKDTVEIYQILNELDSLKIQYISISNFTVVNDNKMNTDSLRQAQYDISYYDKNKKLIDSKVKNSSFLIKNDPKKFKQEFKFYFKKLNDVKDTISNGVTQ